jgi:L-lactate dehydrogenase complex protein LldF
MKVSSPQFKAKVVTALADPHLRDALGQSRKGFVNGRGALVAGLPEFEQLRDQARDVKNHVLAHLDHYLERFEAQVTAAGGQVHWAPTPRTPARSSSASASGSAPGRSPRASRWSPRKSASTKPWKPRATR